MIANIGAEERWSSVPVRWLLNCSLTDLCWPPWNLVHVRHSIGIEILHGLIYYRKCLSEFIKILKSTGTENALRDKKNELFKTL